MAHFQRKSETFAILFAVCVHMDGDMANLI